MNQAALDEINKKLKQTFGTSQDGRAKWRLIWSESEEGYEYRRGTFNRFSDSDPEKGTFEKFLRTEEGLFKERKYSWIKNRYLLETLVYQPNPEIPESNKGHYELRYTTQDSQGNYLPPKWEVYEAIIYFFISGKAQVKIDWYEYFAKQSKDYKQWVKDRIEDNFPLIAHQKLAGEVSFVPSTYGDKPVNVLKDKN